MNKKVLIISCIFLGNLSFAQTPGTISHPDATENSIKETKILKINISDYPLETMESFKDELMGWKEKISSVDINEPTKELILTHFLTLDNRELFDILNKYNIQKNAIVSYK